jgi:hypothetical protein
MPSDPSAMNRAESLQVVLACLDLSLESELALYRRQNLQTSGALALSESDQSDESSSRFETDPEESSLANSGNTKVDINPLQSLFSNADDPQEVSATALSAPESNPQEVAIAKLEKNGVQNSGSTVREVTSFAGEFEEDPETLPEPYSTEAVSRPEALDRFLDPSIEDYLESSEALLKHLDDSEGAIAKPVKPTKSARQLKKPSPPKSSPPTSAWAFKLLGGVLATALLIGIAMLVLKQLTTKLRNAPVPQPSLQSSIQPSLQPTVQTSLAPASVRPSAIAVTPLSLKPTSVPVSSPKAASALVSPKPTVRPSAFYAVVAPYRDNASLQRARRLVPDAFIADINGQRNIQLAFLDDLQRAQRLVNDLKNEGFPAVIVSQN